MINFPFLTLCSNDGLVMPPKPNEENRALAFYNIDFSLANQVETFYFLDLISGIRFFKVPDILIFTEIQYCLIISPISNSNNEQIKIKDMLSVIFNILFSILFRMLFLTSICITMHDYQKMCCIK